MLHQLSLGCGLERAYVAGKKPCVLTSLLPTKSVAATLEDMPDANYPG